MRDLTIWLDTLDPEAGTALRVISYFEELVAHGAGLHAILRAAAKLTECAVALIDDDRQIRIRLGSEGTPAPISLRDPAWPQSSVGAGSAVLWVERSGPPHPLDALVVERAAGAAAVVLNKTSHQSPVRIKHDEIDWAKMAVDASVPVKERRLAVMQLGLTSERLQPVALLGGEVRLVAGDGLSSLPADLVDVRAGVGPAGPIEDLPEAGGAARLSLRLTAEGNETDPGPRIVYAERAGGLLVLAQSVNHATPRHPDVVVLETASHDAPTFLATMDAYASTPSVRAAAESLRIHHSTLQERLTRAERLLGWSLRNHEGRLRLQLALVLRRLHRSSVSDWNDP